MRKKKKLILRILAFGIAFEVVLLAALLLDLPTSSQELVKAIEIGRMDDALQPAGQGLEESYPAGENQMDEELSGAELDDSMFIDEPGSGDLLDPSLDGSLPGPEPYDFGDTGMPSYNGFDGGYPAPESIVPNSDFTGGSPDDGEGEIGAEFEDNYGDTWGCDGDCDEDTVPDVPDDLPPAADPVQPTSVVINPAPEQPQQPTQVPPTAAPPADPVPPAPINPTQAAPTPEPASPRPAGGLVAVPASSAPVLDGSGSDAAWASAPELMIETAGGANDSAARVSVRAMYDSDRVYFLFKWEDPTNSWLRNPWEKQPDGSWKRLTGTQNAGNDENEFYEDELALLWPVNDSIPGFASEGCGTACHLGEGGDEKPVGSMHTNDPDQRADLWNWKSWRNIGQIDDLYLNSSNYKDDYWAGFQKDPSDGGGYSDNENKNGKSPAYMPPDGGERTGFPGFIYAPERVAFDDSLFQPGDRLPSVIAEPFLGDRGDISAGWTYVEGRWTLEMSRPLVTGSSYDVQFDNLGKVYYFALATFDNTQIRHAVQAGATPFTFQK